MNARWLGFGLGCARFRSRLPLLAGGELTGGERRAVERHLIECADCRARHARAADLVRLVRESAAAEWERDCGLDSESGVGLWPSLARQIREARHESGCRAGLGRGRGLGEVWAGALDRAGGLIEGARAGWSSGWNWSAAGLAGAGLALALSVGLGLGVIGRAGSGGSSSVSAGSGAGPAEGTGAGSGTAGASRGWGDWDPGAAPIKFGVPAPAGIGDDGDDAVVAVNDAVRESGEGLEGNAGGSGEGARGAVGVGVGTGARRASGADGGRRRDEPAAELIR